MKVKTTKTVHIGWLMAVQGVLAYEWLTSGWEKFSDGKFMKGIAKTLAAFASDKNPHRWYAEFLKANILPHAQLFGNVVRTSELLAGLVLAVGALAVWRVGTQNRALTGLLSLTAFLAALLNLNFYFASGYSSASTAGINLVMALVELVLAAMYARLCLYPSSRS